jgi:hypothetical protein
MSLKKTWDYIVSHNIWSKVAAWLIYTTLGGIGLGIYSLFKNLSFTGVFGSVLNYKLPVWVFLISVIIFILFRLAIKAYRKKKHAAYEDSQTSYNLSVSIPTNSSKVQEPAPPTLAKVPANAIFDSNLSQDGWWNGYGKQDWDTKSNSPVGEKGQGAWHYKEQILTVARDNVKGKYVIFLKQYFYRKKIVSSVPPDLFGDNPRYFSIKLLHRAFSGSHKVIVVFKKKEGHIWINQVDFEITQTDWVRYVANLAIKADEEFVIELQTWSFEAKSRFQIKDLVINENRVVNK